jgi:hypothetical protein
VSLDLLPATLSERAGWERSIGRWGRACGCESSSLAFLSVIALLVIARVGFDVELAPEGLPAPVWWALTGLVAAVVRKLAVVLIARRSALSWPRSPAGTRVPMVVLMPSRRPPRPCCHNAIRNGVVADDHPTPHEMQARLARQWTWGSTGYCSAETSRITLSTYRWPFGRCRHSSRFNSRETARYPSATACRSATNCLPVDISVIS